MEYQHECHSHYLPLRLRQQPLDGIRRRNHQHHIQWQKISAGRVYPKRREHKSSHHAYAHPRQYPLLPARAFLRLPSPEPGIYHCRPRKQESRASSAAPASAPPTAGGSPNNAVNPNNKKLNKCCPVCMIHGVFSTATAVPNNSPIRIAWTGLNGIDQPRRSAKANPCRRGQHKESLLPAAELVAKPPEDCPQHHRSGRERIHKAQPICPQPTTCNPPPQQSQSNRLCIQPFFRQPIRPPDQNNPEVQAPDSPTAAPRYNRPMWRSCKG